MPPLSALPTDPRVAPPARSAALLLLVSWLLAVPAFAQPGPPPPANTPGTCPAGTTRVDIGSVSALQDASRGERAYADDPPNTCYFIANGTYSSGLTLPMYFLKGGSAPGARYFVGATRQGVVIRGRSTVEGGIGNLVITNLTFDMTGYDQGGSYSTLTIGAASNITVKDVTFTGDCVAGKNGGHIESDGVDGLTVDSVLVEKFGRCGTFSGHQDHGIYISYGSNITIRNSIIRGNSSRGIQMYTAGAPITGVTIQGNWIYQNGHADYEDGIVISGDTAITNLLIERNLIYKNYYSGIRFVGSPMSGVSIVQNTFDSNGAGSTSSSRSEVNLDASGSGAGTTFWRNIFNAGNRLINNCYDSAGRGFSINDNVLNGSGAGNCVGTVIQANPQFVDAANGDYHTQNPDVRAYGAYADDGSDFFTLTPCRAFDTRDPRGPTLGAPIRCGTDRSLTIVGGTCGVPASAKAVSLNLTATAPTAQGNLRVFPAGLPAPLASTLNYAAGQTRANSAVARLGVDNQIAIRCMPSGTTHVIVDVNGYFQ